MKTSSIASVANPAPLVSNSADFRTRLASPNFNRSALSMLSWLTLPALSLVFVVPGATLAWTRLRLEARTQEPFLQFFIESIYSSVAISSMVMIILLEFGQFRISTLLWALGIMSAVIWTIGISQNYRLRFTFHWPEACALSVTFLLFFLLAFPPFNYAIGDTDPGMYVVGGHQIARTGHIHVEIPSIAQTPPGLLWQPTSIFVAQDLPSALRSSGGRIGGRYEGVWTSAMFVTDADSGRVTPQFLHLWMLWIALFVSLFGGSLGVIGLPALAALGALGVYGAAKELFESYGTALCILILLIFNWTFVYFSRLPVSEMMAFFCLAGGFWALTRFTRSQSILHAWLAGLLFGLSFFARVDFIYQAPAFGALFVYLFLIRQIHLRWFIFYASLAATSIWALFHNFTYSWPYMLSCICYVGICRFLEAKYLVLLAAVIVAAIGGLLLGRSVMDGWPRSPGSRRSWTMASMFLAITFGGFFVYNSLPGMPLVTVKGVVSDWASNEILDRFILAIGLPVLLLGMAGACELLRRRGDDLAILVALFFLLDIWFIHSIIRPIWFIIPYGLRYYVTDLVPALSFCAGWMIFDFGSRLHRSRIPVVLALICLSLLPSAVILTRLAPYEGMHRTYADLSHLASQVEPDAIVLFDESNVLKAFQSPLYTIFGVEAHTVSGVDSEQGTGESGALRQWILTSSRPVYLLGGHDVVQYAGIPVHRVGRGVLTVTEVQQVGQYRHLKLDWTDWHGEYSLYKFPE